MTTHTTADTTAAAVQDDGVWWVSVEHPDYPDPLRTIEVPTGQDTATTFVTWLTGRIATYAADHPAFEDLTWLAEL